MLNKLLKKDLIFIKIIDYDCHKVMKEIVYKEYFSYPTKDTVNCYDLVFVWLNFLDHDEFYIGYVKNIEYRTVVSNIFIHSLIELNHNNIFMTDFISFDGFAIKLEKEIRKEFLSKLYSVADKELDYLMSIINKKKGLSEQEN